MAGKTINRGADWMLKLAILIRNWSNESVSRVVLSILCTMVGLGGIPTSNNKQIPYESVFINSCGIFREKKYYTLSFKSALSPKMKS